MRGLIRSILIMAALITIGTVTSIILTSDLNSKLASARGSGIEEGRVQGYEAGFQGGSVAGYQAGSQAGYARSSQNHTTNRYEAGFYFSYNPTYDEVEKLLAEKEKASAWQIHNYAEANGVRVAYVRVQIARPAAEGEVWVYRLLAFDTVDKGFVILEPWSRQVRKVAVGERFHALNGFPTPPYDDTVTKMTIIW